MQLTSTAADQQPATHKPDQGTKKPQLLQDQPQIVATTTQQGVEGITFRAFQPVPP